MSGLLGRFDVDADKENQPPIRRSLAERLEAFKESLDRRKLHDGFEIAISSPFELQSENPTVLLPVRPRKRKINENSCVSSGIKAPLFCPVDRKEVSEPGAAPNPSSIDLFETVVINSSSESGSPPRRPDPESRVENNILSWIGPSVKEDSRADKDEEVVPQIKEKGSLLENELNFDFGVEDNFLDERLENIPINVTGILSSHVEPLAGLLGEWAFPRTSLESIPCPRFHKEGVFGFEDEHFLRNLRRETTNWRLAIEECDYSPICHGECFEILKNRFEAVLSFASSSDSIASIGRARRRLGFPFPPVPLVEVDEPPDPTKRVRFFEFEDLDACESNEDSNSIRTGDSVVSSQVASGIETMLEQFQENLPEIFKVTDNADLEFSFTDENKMTEANSKTNVTGQPHENMMVENVSPIEPIDKNEFQTSLISHKVNGDFSKVPLIPLVDSSIDSQAISIKEDNFYQDACRLNDLNHMCELEETIHPLFDLNSVNNVDFFDNLEETLPPLQDLNAVKNLCDGNQRDSVFPLQYPSPVNDFNVFGNFETNSCLLSNAEPVMNIFDNLEETRNPLECSALELPLVFSLDGRQNSDGKKVEGSQSFSPSRAKVANGSDGDSFAFSTLSASKGPVVEPEPDSFDFRLIIPLLRTSTETNRLCVHKGESGVCQMCGVVEVTSSIESKNILTILSEQIHILTGIDDSTEFDFLNIDLSTALAAACQRSDDKTAPFELEKASASSVRLILIAGFTTLADFIRCRTNSLPREIERFLKLLGLDSSDPLRDFRDIMHRGFDYCCKLFDKSRVQETKNAIENALDFTIELAKQIHPIIRLGLRTFKEWWRGKKTKIARSKEEKAIRDVCKVLFILPENLHRQLSLAIEKLFPDVAVADSKRVIENPRAILRLVDAGELFAEVSREPVSLSLVMLFTFQREAEFDLDALRNCLNSSINSKTRFYRIVSGKSTI